ncbi:hypothetical protein TraAM80_01288 [Trypanosoma rangeli]|uniref:Uncharacterized protein n=1 Tax=Trypanosoma rangeli TaxID=5698 RepID=A0A422NZQ7_TRYRA|nr:uncharacterized protein TraAM80_01288 [Trypanosoma rangeli]RNF10904.1 hypothetical protein TraAM80_01288 [Trypanosoma rangeli]|eukprot:RNF10904.1 hypothetical protein TraAM80_01288 [Trypanosoma rangeli]
MTISDSGCLASVKRLLVQEPWENPVRASEVICSLLDASLMWCCGDKTCDHPVANAEDKVEVAGLFFNFVRYFATALTRKRLGGVRGAPTTADTSVVSVSAFTDATVGAPQPHSAAAYQSKLRSSVVFPPIHELWRQPSLVAAIERLAEVVWSIQMLLHAGDGHVCVAQVGRCPLCYAASIEHVSGTDAMWSLLEFYAVYRVAEVSSDRGIRKSSSLTDDPSTDASHELILVLDVDTRRLLWTHAMAVCRNAVWNGAVQTLRLSVEQWVYSGTHPTLFATVHQQGSPTAVQVDGDVISLFAFILIQCCLLIQDEVVFEMDVRTAAMQATPAGKRQYKSHRHGALEEACHEKEDGDVASQASSSLSLEGRGDAGLYDSLVALREMSHAAGVMAAFVALTMTAPHYATGGVTLLHWVCAKGYEFCVRLLLTAWVAVYRDARLPPSVTSPVACEEKRVRVDFGPAQVLEVPTDTAAAPKTTAKAIRCTALQVDDEILSCAVRGGNVSVLRQLLLCGASRHQWKDKEPTDKEVVALLLDPGSVLDGVVGTLHERVRDALCATAAADALAIAAWRLWSEKVQKLAVDKAGEAPYRRSHDGVMRTTLAALEFDPHNPLARTTLRDLLARKVTDILAAKLPTGEAALHQRRYCQTARRMCEQLLTTHTGREGEMESLLRFRALPSADSSSLMKTTTAHMASDNTFLFLPFAESAGVSGGGGGGSSATIAIDKQRRPVFALVNLTDSAVSPTSKTTAMMHPLWVRLPHGVDVHRSLELAGGLYGVVESAMPLIAPVERGDLVVFTLRQKCYRFDVTRIVRPQDGVVVEVPCVLQGTRDEVKTSVLRCALVPPPVYELDDDRVVADPLQWLERASTPTSDAVEQILNSRQHLQRWLHIAHRGRRTLWFNEVPLAPSEASVWRLGKAYNEAEARPIFATASFPLVGRAEAEVVDDPFGLTSETIFVLRPAGTRVVEGDVAFRVAGVFPRWGWG